MKKMKEVDNNYITGHVSWDDDEGLASKFGLLSPNEEGVYISMGKMNHSLELKATMCRAARTGDLATLKKEVEKGVDLTDHLEILVWALIKNKVEIIIYCKEKGVDLKTQDNYALRFSCENNFLKLTQSLVECGCDIDVVIEKGTDNIKNWAIEYKKSKDLAEKLNSNLKEKLEQKKLKV